MGDRGAPDALFRFHGQALPRGGAWPSDGEWQAVSARLHVDEAHPATAGPCDGGAEAFGAPQEARPSAPARHAAVSRRLASRLAARGAEPRPRGDHGRRDERDPLGGPGRGGRHGLELHRAQGGDHHAWAILRLLHRPRQPLLRDAEGWGTGRQNAADPGRPGGAG